MGLLEILDHLLCGAAFLIQRFSLTSCQGDGALEITD